MKKLMFILGLLSIAFLANAKTPKFTDYSVNKVYQGKSAKLLIKSDFERNYITRLNWALGEKPNFAGEYIITYWGCGAGCRVHSIINKRTGEVLDDGFGGEIGPYLENFKLNSRLIVSHGPEYDKNGDEIEDGKYFTYFYIIEKNKLRLIGKELRKRPDYFEIYAE